MKGSLSGPGVERNLWRDGLPKFSLMSTTPPRGPGPRNLPAEVAASDTAAASVARPTGEPRLLDRVKGEIRLRYNSTRTETVYAQLVRRFVLFQDKRHLRDMGADEVAKFLAYLALERDVSPSTHG